MFCNFCQLSTLDILAAAPHMWPRHNQINLDTRVAKHTTRSPKIYDLDAAPRFFCTSQHTFLKALNLALATSCAFCDFSTFLILTRYAVLPRARRFARRSRRSSNRKWARSQPQKLSIGLRSGQRAGMWMSSRCCFLYRARHGLASKKVLLLVLGPIYLA